jgi:hypothetical protein
MHRRWEGSRTRPPEEEILEPGGRKCICSFISEVKFYVF